MGNVRLGRIEIMDQDRLLRVPVRSLLPKKVSDLAQKQGLTIGISPYEPVMEDRFQVALFDQNKLVPSWTEFDQLLAEQLNDGPGYELLYKDGIHAPVLFFKGESFDEGIVKYTVLETVAQFRGCGIGTAFLENIDRLLAKAGIRFIFGVMDDQFVGSEQQNADPRYERRMRYLMGQQRYFFEELTPGKWSDLLAKLPAEEFDDCSFSFTGLNEYKEKYINIRFLRPEDETSFVEPRFLAAEVDGRIARIVRHKQFLSLIDRLYSKVSEVAIRFLDKEETSFNVESIKGLIENPRRMKFEPKDLQWTRAMMAVLVRTIARLQAKGAKLDYPVEISGLKPMQSDAAGWLMITAKLMSKQSIQMIDTLSSKEIEAITRQYSMVIRSV